MLIRLNIDRLRKAAAAKGDDSDARIAERTRVHGSTIWRLAQPDSSQELKVSTCWSLGRPYGLTFNDLIIVEDDETELQPAAA